MNIGHQRKISLLERATIIVHQKIKFAIVNILTLASAVQNGILRMEL